MVRLGIIGCGGMGNMHAQACLVSGAATLTAVADDYEENAKKLAQTANCDYHTNYKDLLSRGDVDVVMICTPTPSHYSLGMEALAAKKHTFIEKPLARKSDRARELVQEAEKQGVYTMVGHVLRFWPEYTILREALEDQRWGKLKAARFIRWSNQPAWSVGNWLLDPELSGGAAFDLHLHDTDMVLYLFGEPKSVFSAGVKDYAGWRHITTHYFYEGDSPAITAEGGWYEGEKYPFRMGFVAHFEEGVLDYDCSRPQPFIFYPKEGDEQVPALPEVPKTKPVEGINVTDLGGYLLQDTYFFQQLAENKAPSRASFEVGLKAIQTVEREIQSAEKREVVTL